MTKVFIAHPSGGSVNPFTHNSLMYNMWELGWNQIEIEKSRQYDEYPLSRARNEIVKDFLDSDCSHLFMYDDDSVFTTGTLLRLLEVDKDIVSGWYLARKGDLGLVLFVREGGKELLNIDDFAYYRPMTIRELYSRKDSDNPKLSIVDGIGLGVVLIKREAVEHLYEVCEKKDIPMFAEWNPILGGDIHQFGEDLWFSDVCAYAGMPLYVHRGCFIGHWAKQGFILSAEALQKRMMMEHITEFKLVDLVS